MRNPGAKGRAGDAGRTKKKNGCGDCEKFNYRTVNSFEIGHLGKRW